MEPTPLANGGSSNFMSYNFLLGMNFLNQMVSVYWETIHGLFILYASNISLVLETFHLIFIRERVVDRDLTKFQDCGFLHARNTACNTFKITF